MVVVFRDITERRKLETELQKIQKLESIGMLAGGIAHDFNNILSRIVGNISLAKMKLDQDQETHRLLDETQQATFEARHLTQQLLTFSKGGKPVKEVANIKDLLKTSVTFALRGSNVRCFFDLPDDLWAVNVDKGQITQVVSNLVINADQGMPEGGKITISARNIAPGTKYESVPLRNIPYVKISIQDEGIGIPTKTLPKIFDPYFTTKQRGSGLGLAISFSITSKHEGFITVESELGFGTTFFIYLPASPERAPEQESRTGKLHKGKGRVLVMDDDRPLRNMLRQMLNSIGYEVDCASDGVDALDLWKQAHSSGNPYDLIILDLTVRRGIGGEQAIRELLKLDPNTRAIVCSGYSNDPIMAEFKDYGFCAALTKPFKFEELSRKVREVIDDKQQRQVNS